MPLVFFFKGVVLGLVRNQLQEVFDAEDTTDVQMEMPVPSGFLPMGFPELAMQLETQFVTPKMVVFTRGNPEPLKCHEFI